MGGLKSNILGLDLKGEWTRIILDWPVVNILSHLTYNENESQDLNLGSVALESVPMSSIQH